MISFGLTRLHTWPVWYGGFRTATLTGAVTRDRRPLEDRFQNRGDVATAVEGGQTFVYAAGYGQAAFANFCRSIVSKLDASGTVLWTRTDEAEMVGVACSALNAVAVLNGNVYGAGGTRDDGTLRPLLRKYDANGNLIWVRTKLFSHVRPVFFVRESQIAADPSLAMFGKSCRIGFA